MHKIESIQTGEKNIGKFYCAGNKIILFELGASGVVLQCTNHYTKHAITILKCKLLYINVTSTIQQQSYFSK